MSRLREASRIIHTAVVQELSEDMLLQDVAEILARPGDFTPQELDELAIINAEFIRRQLDN